MKKNYNVKIEDNGAAYLIVINPGTPERLVVAAEHTLAAAWDRIYWMYAVETQEFDFDGRPAAAWAADYRRMRREGLL